MKAGLTDEQIADYFRRSYVAVDGLWFMKVEEKWGFEAALLADEMVWGVLPKIQARMLKEMCGLDSGIVGLRQALLTRLTLEGFEFQIEGMAEDEGAGDKADGIKVCIKKCPWHDLLVKSGREKLCASVGDVICGRENAVWAREFGEIYFSRIDRICRGDKVCTLCFLQDSRQH